MTSVIPWLVCLALIGANTAEAGWKHHWSNYHRKPPTSYYVVIKTPETELTPIMMQLIGEQGSTTFFYVYSNLRRYIELIQADEDREDADDNEDPGSSTESSEVAKYDDIIEEGDGLNDEYMDGMEGMEGSNDSSIEDNSRNRTKRDTSTFKLILRGDIGHICKIRFYIHTVNESTISEPWYLQQIEIGKVYGGSRPQIFAFNRNVARGEFILGQSKGRDGEWSGWKDSSSCTKQCESGTKTQIRYCNYPDPMCWPGKRCAGQSMRRAPCNARPCSSGEISGESTTTMQSERHHKRYKYHYDRYFSVGLGLGLGILLLMISCVCFMVMKRRKTKDCYDSEADDCSKNNTDVMWTYNEDGSVTDSQGGGGKDEVPPSYADLFSSKGENAADAKEREATQGNGLAAELPEPPVGTQENEAAELGNDWVPPIPGTDEQKLEDDKMMMAPAGILVMAEEPLSLEKQIEKVEKGELVKDSIPTVSIVCQEPIKEQFNDESPIMQM